MNSNSTVHSSAPELAAGLACEAAGWRVAATLRRTGVTAVACGVLALAGWAPSASAAMSAPSRQPESAPVVRSEPTAALPSLPAWCPFGTRHGKGSGCRGGSINDNEAVNSYFAQEWVLWRDATTCAVTGLGGAAGPESPSSVAGYGLKAEGGAVACGIATQDKYLKDMDRARRGGR